MNGLTRIDPIDNLFPDFFRRFARNMRMDDVNPVEIRVDVSETDKGYRVRAELPGVRKEDVHVNVDGKYVSISAELKRESEEKDQGRSLVRETYVGSATRSFSLPTDVDASAVTARLDAGILQLELPKREGAGSRQISIQ